MWLHVRGLKGGKGLLAYAAPFMGAIALEVVHWYELRERLNVSKYRKLVRSWSYWIPTLVMAIVGGGIVLVWAQSRSPYPGALELLIAGAAAPSLIKKLVEGFLSKQETVLGEEDERVSLRDY